MYLIPSGYNSIASFLATREPLYRQNVFQFFSGMNQAYTKLVKVNGLIMGEKSLESDKLNHLKQLYDNVIQTYIRDARRTFDIKVFKAKVWCKGDASPKIYYFTNRIEIGSM